MDGAFIATVASDKPCDLRMLAFHLDGEVRENFNYPILGTPCETVVGHGFRLYPSRLPELFPLDEDFRKLGLESYAGHPLTDAAGRPLGLIAVIARRPFRDPALVEATLRIFAVRVNAELERAAAARALRASEANYRQIFEASEDSIFVHDWETGAIVDVNARACETYGYTREELLGLGVRDLSAQEPLYTEAEALRWIEQAKREGSAGFEWRRRNKDGSLHWDEVRLKRAQIGGQLRIVAFTREITERKLAEEALRASEEQYRAVFNASADALVLWNSRSERVDVNPAYERMYGYSRDEVLAGARARELDAGHRQLQAEIIERTLAGRALPRRNGDRPAQRRALSDRGAHDPDPAPGRAARAGDDPGPDRASQGRAGASPARGPAAPGAEDGGDRPADGRHRARLQQPADVDHGLRCTRGRAGRRARGSPTRRLPGAGATLL